MVKKIIIVIFLILSPAISFGQVYIIDNGAKEADATWNEADGTSYATSLFPSGALGYGSLGGWATTVTPSAGDKIYCRVGTYSEDYTLGSVVYTSMPLPFTGDGTSFSEGEYILFASYPDEWAVFDGNGNDRCVLGVYSGGHSPSQADYGDPDYWVFERFEVTNPLESSSSCGLGVNSGPFKARYLYIHDIPGTQSENTGGIRGYRFTNGTVIEFCYFSNIGNPDETIWNIGAIVDFSDYTYDDGLPGDTDSRGYFTAATTRQGYEVRYCHFSDIIVGVRDKAFQPLMSNSTDMTYKTYGPKINHNFFDSEVVYGTSCDTDFAWIEKNIFDGCYLQIAANRAGVPNQDVSPLNVVVNNNTIINGALSYAVEDENNPGTNKDFYFYCYNNIVTGFGTDTYQPSIGFATVACYSGNCSSAQADCTPNWTNSKIDRNLIHDPQSAYHVGGPYSDPCCNATRWYSVSGINTLLSATNYTNSTSGLFLGVSGSDQYTTDGTFVIGATTIASGGINTGHPYLDGETIPDYVGATDPDDYAWVDGVLTDLISTAWLKSTTTDRDANDDPTWIEGAGSPPASSSFSTATYNANGASGSYNANGLTVSAQ